MLRCTVMTWVVSLAFIGLTMSARAESLLVAPDGFDDVEGNFRLLNHPPPPNGIRIQWVHPSSDFQSLPDHLDTITSIRWRPDSTVTYPKTTVFDNLELTVSSTTAAPGFLNSAMDENVGDDATVVYSGAITFETDGSGAPGGPRAFDYVINFQTPFVYDPSQGNLLLDYSFKPPVDGRPTVDAQGYRPPPAMISGQGPGPAYIVTQFGFYAADFDGTGELTGADIDLLSAAVGNRNTNFDLDGNGAVEQEDRRIWVEDVYGTSFGDANLNKEVTFADFVALSSNYSLSGGWAQGDFDGNGLVQFADFVLLSANFGKSNTSGAAVPEPGAALLLAMGMIGLARRRSGSCANRVKP